jgi:hypothetical protein
MASSSAERLRCSRDSGWTQVPASEAGSCPLPRRPGKPLVRIGMTSGPSGSYRPPSSASVGGRRSARDARLFGRRARTGTGRCRHPSSHGGSLLSRSRESGKTGFRRHGGGNRRRWWWPAGRRSGTARLGLAARGTGTPGECASSPRNWATVAPRRNNSRRPSDAGLLFAKADPLRREAFPLLARASPLRSPRRRRPSSRETSRPHLLTKSIPGAGPRRRFGKVPRSFSCFAGLAWDGAVAIIVSDARGGNGSARSRAFALRPHAPVASANEQQRRARNASRARSARLHS